MIQTLIQLMKSKFKVETRIVDTEEELSLVVVNMFSDEVIYEHRQDLMPLFKAFKNRLENVQEDN